MSDKALFTKDLPPLPWSYVVINQNVYILDANGRRIARLLGNKSTEGVDMAEFICDASDRALASINAGG